MYLHRQARVQCHHLRNQTQQSLSLLAAADLSLDQKLGLAPILVQDLTLVLGLELVLEPVLDLEPVLEPVLEPEPELVPELDQQLSDLECHHLTDQLDRHRNHPPRLWRLRGQRLSEGSLAY